MATGIGMAKRAAFRAVFEVKAQRVKIVVDYGQTTEAESEAQVLRSTRTKGSRDAIFQFVEQLEIPRGSILQLVGSRDLWKVTDTEDVVIENTFVNLDVHAEKIDAHGLPTRRSPLASNIYNLHGAQSRVNIHSSDSSLNVSNSVSDSVFADIRHAFESTIHNTDEKALLIGKLDELEAAKGTVQVTEKYREFISVAANHMTVLAPFIPALSHLLGP